MKRIQYGVLLIAATLLAGCSGGGTGDGEGDGNGNNKGGCFVVK